MKYMKHTETQKSLWTRIKPGSLRSMFIASSLTVLVGTVFYHYVEDLRWIDSLYFSVITITTVGYGDFTPQTDLGKLFTVFYIINGLGIIYGFINALYERRVSITQKVNR